ncbi:MAG: ammonia-dependent NAD(+) synthetase [Nocardioidaceae bacterium]
MPADHRQAQRDIARDLGVADTFDAADEAERRVRFLARLLADTGLSTLVLGISGGVDSAAAGALCRQAVDRCRTDGGSASFVAIHLPYGRQADVDDVRAVLEALHPDEVLTVDVRPASDAALQAVEDAGLTFASEEQRDFVLGNIKARQRMVTQYAVAGTRAGLVVGTDHAAEAVTGFFTKYGDGGVDVVPLAGLTKRRVRALAAHLAMPENIVTKVPTADLHTLKPQRADEDELGLSYQQIDDFLEGADVDPEVAAEIIERHRNTAHKRSTPTAPPAPA